MIGEITELEAEQGIGRIRAQGNAGTFIFGFDTIGKLTLRVGDIVSFMPHRVGDTRIAIAIQAEDQFRASDSAVEAASPS